MKEGKFKKYEIIRDSIEIHYRDRKKIKEACSICQNSLEHEEIESFDSSDEALEALKKYKTDISEFSHSNLSMFLVTEYYVEEAVYDEDGDWVDGGDIWEFTKMEIAVIAKEPFERLIGIYDNYADAEEAYNDYLAGYLDNYEEDYEEDEDDEWDEIEREAEIYMGGSMDWVAELPLLNDSLSSDDD